MKDLKKYKVYVSACGKEHANFLEPLGFELTDHIEESDLVLFGGGADINPATYGEEPNKRTYISENREKIERADFRYARAHDKKMFGICRGHQLLCSLAGGKLIQDVTHHSGRSHKITTFDGLTMETNSLHHQMINPYPLERKKYKILAWSSKRLSERYLGARDKSVLLPYEFKEIEAIYFPEIKAMGVQYHPEMMYYGSYKENRKEQGIITWTQKTFMQFFNDAI